VAQGFLFFTTEGTELGGASRRPGAVGSEAALLGPYLMDLASNVLLQALELV